MKLILGVLTLVFALASVACLGISQEEMQAAIDEQAAAAQRKAEASDKKHAETLAVKDKETETRVYELLESLANAEANVKVNAANLQHELSTGRSEIIALQGQLHDKQFQVARLEKQLSSAVTQFRSESKMQKDNLLNLKDQLNKAHELLGEGGYPEIVIANKETRWSWLALDSDFSNPVAYAVAARPSDIHALMLNCYDGKAWLSLWPYGYSLHGGEGYKVIAGFDDYPMRLMETEAYNTGPALRLLDVRAGIFWEADTFSVQGAYGGVTVFDTAQLKRMFPTEGAFCEKDGPNNY